MQMRLKEALLVNLAKNRHGFGKYSSWMPKAKLSKLNTLDNTDTETIFAFRFRLY